MAATNEPSAIDLLRSDTSDKNANRRKIAATAALGLADFSLISLFQLGYIRHLPDLPGELFDTEKVNSSEEAVILGIPDGVVSLGAYAATIALATAGSRSTKYSRLFDLALGGVVVGQAVGGAWYLFNMATVQKKVCIYCVAGALINFSSLGPLVNLLRNK